MEFNYVVATVRKNIVSTHTVLHVFLWPSNGGLKWM